MVWAIGVLLAAVIAVGESPRVVPGVLPSVLPVGSPGVVMAASPSVVPAVVGGPNAKAKVKRSGAQGRRTVFSKELSGGRSVDVVFGEGKAAAAKGDGKGEAKSEAKGDGKGDEKVESKGDGVKGDGAKGEAAKGDGVKGDLGDVLSYRFHLKLEGGEVQEMSRWDYPGDADLKSVEILDVGVNATNELAVVVWNESEFVWADALTRDSEGKWKTLPRPAFFLDDGTNSLGRGARFAETVIDEQNGVVLTVTHFDGTVDQFRMKMTDRVGWEKLK